jgi:hypothetical protein
MRKLLQYLLPLTLPAPLLVAWDLTAWIAGMTYREAKTFVLFLWTLARAAFGVSTAAVGRISFGDVLHTLAVGLSVGAAVAQGGSEVLGIIAGALGSLAAFVARKQSGPNPPAPQ